jgi:hypothetical protein
MTERQETSTEESVPILRDTDVTERGRSLEPSGRTIGDTDIGYKQEEGPIIQGADVTGAPTRTTITYRKQTIRRRRVTRTTTWTTREPTEEEENPEMEEEEEEVPPEAGGMTGFTGLGGMSSETGQEYGTRESEEPEEGEEEQGEEREGEE